MSDFSSSSTLPEHGRSSDPTAAQLAFSCRLPLLVMFISAAVWLIIASAFGLLSSLTFHAPGLLADHSWLTYGRLRPAYENALLYGFCLQAGLGVALWLFVRLGRTLLAQRLMVTLGAAFWNFGVTVGIAAILGGYSTGFENLEMPGHASVIVFGGYVLLGLWGVITFHRRRVHALFPSQWFLFAALFWFPWIYSTANLLLLTFPARGVAQSVIAWWYSENLVVVWLGLVGLGSIFYFVPKLSGRDLHSHYLALFTFWTLILFASWGGIPSAAPVPAWMPTVSTIASVFMILPLLAVGMNVYRTLGRVSFLSRQNLPLSFELVGVAAFLIAGVMKISLAGLDTDQMLQFTWFASARKLLHVYGFFVMAMFGAIYYILPRLTDADFPSPGLVRAHFWLSLAGLLFIVAPWAIGGVVQAAQLGDPHVAFISIVKSQLRS